MRSRSKGVARWLLLLGLVVAAAAGCGRINFETLEEAPDDAGQDAASVALAHPLRVNAPRFESSSESYEEVPGSGSDLLPAAWLIVASATLATDGSRPRVRMVLDGEAVAEGSGEQEAVTAYQQFWYLPEASVSRRFHLELIREGTRGTVSIEDLEVALIPMPTAADASFTTQDTVVVPTDYAEFWSATLTPSSPGFYVVFFGGGLSEFPSGGPASFRALLDGNRVQGIRHSNDDRNLHSSLLVTLLELNGPVRFSLEGGSADPNGTLVQPHLLAFRAGAFSSASNSVAVDVQELPLLSTTEMGSSALQSTAQHTLLLQTMLVDFDGGSLFEVEFSSSEGPLRKREYLARTDSDIEVISNIRLYESGAPAAASASVTSQNVAGRVYDNQVFALGIE